MTLADLQNYTI